MKLVDVINKMNAKKNGTWFSVKYKSQPTVKANFKKLGISVVKYSENVVRTGVAYDRIGAVIRKKLAENYVPAPARENHNEWVIPNKILFNNNTNKYAVRLGFCNGHKAKVDYKAYDINGNEIPFEKDYVIDSYWNKPSTDLSVMNITIDNLVSIG